jgi:tetratricopeptide (TPR) repeat protein
MANKSIETALRALEAAKVANPMWPYQLSRCLSGIGLVFVNGDKLELALECAEMALDISSKHCGQLSLPTAEAYRRLCTIYIKKGDKGKVFESAQKAFNIAKEVLGEKHPRIGYFYEGLANAYWMIGGKEQSLKYRRLEYKCANTFQTEDGRRINHALRNLVNTLVLSSRRPEAMHLLQRLTQDNQSSHFVREEAARLIREVRPSLKK